MSNRTITIDATGRQEAAPDLATVTVTAIAGGGSAAAAHRATRDRASTVRESVTAVPADRIRTVDLDVQETDELFESETDEQFQATERLHIDCVPETAADIVVDVVDAGGTVQSVQFELHPERHRECQDAALSAAMDRARHKAERIAAAEGLSVGDVQTVTAGELETGMGTLVDEALAAHSTSDMQPTPIAVTEDVKVVYELICK